VGERLDGGEDHHARVGKQDEDDRDPAWFRERLEIGGHADVFLAGVDVTPEDDEDTTTGQSWGHLENVKDNMT